MRHSVPGHPITLELEELWLPQILPAEMAPEQRGSMGQYFTHRPSGLQLNARTMTAPDDASLSGLLLYFEDHAAVSWPSASAEIEHGARGLLWFVAGTFTHAIPGKVVREWFVSDGKQVANFAAFADDVTWKAALPACWRLALSVEFLGEARIGHV